MQISPQVFEDYLTLYVGSKLTPPKQFQMVILDSFSAVAPDGTLNIWTAVANAEIDFVLGNAVWTCIEAEYGASIVATVVLVSEGPFRAGLCGDLFLAPPHGRSFLNHFPPRASAFLRRSGTRRYRPRWSTTAAWSSLE